MGKIFGILSEKTRLHRYYHNKNQLVDTSSSYINITVKLLIRSYLLAQKQAKNEISIFLGKQYLTFIGSLSLQAS